MGNNLSIEAEISDLEKVIGKRLYILRLQKGLKLQALAAFSGVSIQQVSKYEKGLSRITAGALFRIAKNMNVPIVSFFPASGEILKLETIVKVEAEFIHCLRKTPRHQQERLLELMKFLSNKDEMTQKLTHEQFEMLIINKM